MKWVASFGGVLSLGYMIGHIPNALGLIELADEEVVVRIVVDDELDFREVAAPIGKLLGHVNAIEIDVAIIHEGVIVAGIAALPGEDNIVGVPCVAVGHRGIAVHRGLVGDPQGAVGIAGIDHAGLHIDLPAGIVISARPEAVMEIVMTLAPSDVVL